MDANSTRAIFANFTGNGEILSREFQTVITAVQITTSLLSITLIFLIFYRIHRRELFGKSTNTFVISVITSDLIVALLASPANIVIVCLGGEQTAYLCKTYYYVLFLSKTSVSYTLIIMAFKKASALMNPQNASANTGKCMFSVWFVWFFAAAYSIWTIVLYSARWIQITTLEASSGLEKHSLQMSVCFISNQFRYLHNTFIVMDFLVILMLPAVMLLVLSAVVFFKYRTGKLNGRYVFSCMRAVKFVFFMFTIHLTCHLPVEIFLFAIYTRIEFSPEMLAVQQSLTVVSFTRGIWNCMLTIYFRNSSFNFQHFPRGSSRTATELRLQMFRQMTMELQTTRDRQSQIASK